LHRISGRLGSLKRGKRQCAERSALPRIAATVQQTEFLLSAVQDFGRRDCKFVGFELNATAFVAAAFEVSRVVDAVVRGTVLAEV